MADSQATSGALEKRIESAATKLQEASTIERELSLLIPMVADLDDNDEYGAITDSRVQRRAEKLKKLANEISRVLQAAQDSPDASGEQHTAEVLSKVHGAIQESLRIAQDLIAKKPLSDTVPYRLGEDADILDKCTTEQGRKHL